MIDVLAQRCCDRPESESRTHLNATPYGSSCEARIWPRRAGARGLYLVVLVREADLGGRGKLGMPADSTRGGLQTYNGRQPFAVMATLVFLPWDAAEDAGQGKATPVEGDISSYGRA